MWFFNPPSHDGTLKVARASERLSSRPPARRHVAADLSRKESHMPASYKPVRRRRAAYTIVKRRNLPFQIRRSGKTGRFREKGGVLVARFPMLARGISETTTRKKRKKPRKTSTKTKTTTRTARKKNPRRRNTGFGLMRRRSRRSRNRPRRYFGRRRRNPGVVVYRRHRGRRRNPGFGLVRGPLQALWQLSTWTAALEGLGGLSVALSVPKMLAKATGIGAFQRGVGGVATAFVSTAVVSGIANAVSRGKLGKGLFVGGIIGSSLLLVSALSSKLREQVFPIEEALLAAALPVRAPMATGPQLTAKAQAVYQNLLNSGQSPDQAMGTLKQLGLSDYYKPGGASDYYSRRGSSDYRQPVAAGTKGAYFEKREKF
jgi:hypothetical protein